MKKTYEERLRIPLEGSSDLDFYTKSGTLVAHGYLRVVIGQRGPYIEFDPKQIVKESFHIPREQEYRKEDKRVYYVEARSNDEANVKLYYQKRPVQYADYKVGLIYISPFELKTREYQELVEPLEKI